MKVRKRHFPRLHGVRWEVDLGMVDGRRVQRLFRTESEARAFAASKKEQRRRFGDGALALSEADRVLFQGARDRLAAAGATITEAVEFFFAKRPVLRGPVTLGRLLEACVQDKELAGKNARYVRQFHSACRSFVAGREDREASSVTRDEVKGWILGNGWEPKTQKGYLGDLRTFFSWAVSERWLAQSPIPPGRAPDAIELPRLIDRDVTAFGPEVCERLLTTALEVERYRCLIGYVTLALFAGVRPEEAQKSPRGAVDLESGTVEVTGGRAKTGRRRVPDLHPNAREWLSLWLCLCPDQEMLIPRNFRRLWASLRDDAGAADWPHDVLRHTFASMHFALHKDAARLKSELGHSQDEDTLERHYKALKTVCGRVVTRAMAERFWGIWPPPRHGSPPGLE